MKLNLKIVFTIIIIILIIELTKSSRKQSSQNDSPDDFKPNTIITRAKFRNVMGQMLIKHHNKEHTSDHEKLYYDKMLDKLEKLVPDTFNTDDLGKYLTESILEKITKEVEQELKSAKKGSTTSRSSQNKTQTEEEFMQETLKQAGFTPNKIITKAEFRRFCQRILLKDRKSSSLDEKEKEFYKKILDKLSQDMPETIIR